MIQMRTQLKLSTNPNTALFIFQSGDILQRKHITKLLDTFNHKITIQNKKFTGHSFRRGGATALAAKGVPDWVIQMLGRWKSDSYKKYIGCQPQQICEFVKHMVT